MTIHKLFEGGNNANRNNQMFPSGTSPAAGNPPYSYADHQRERSYGVTRRLDLRPTVPFGGGGKDQSLLCYLNDNPVAEGDTLLTHLLLPNTLLLGVSYGFTGQLPLGEFSLSVGSAAPADLGTPVTTAAIAVGTPVVNANGQPRATYIPVSPATGGLFIGQEAYLRLVLEELPAPGLRPVAGQAGLNFWVTAHVLDLDHGNA